MHIIQVLVVSEEKPCPCQSILVKNTEIEKSFIQ